MDDFVYVAADLVKYSRRWYFVYSQRKIQRTLLEVAKVQGNPNLLEEIKSASKMKHRDRQPLYPSLCKVSLTDAGISIYQLAKQNSEEQAEKEAHLEPALEISPPPFMWSMGKSLDFQRSWKWEERF